MCLQADWKNPKSDWYIKLNVPVEFQPLSEDTVAVRAERAKRKLAERDAEILPTQRKLGTLQTCCVMTP